MLNRRSIEKQFCKIIRNKNDYEVSHYRVLQQVCLPLLITLVFRRNDGYRRCGKINLNNLNRTPNATIRTYILHQVEYIILHQRHLLPRVNKMNNNTTQSKLFHNFIIDPVL
jgi:hypothetical protein